MTMQITPLGEHTGAEVTGIEYDYPAYMELPPRRSETPDIEAWEGSIVSIIAESTVPVNWA